MGIIPEQYFSQQLLLEHSRYWQCERKITYLTRRAARHARRRIQQETGHKLQLYACIHCDYYHLGHDPDGRNRRQKYFYSLRKDEL